MKGSLPPKPAAFPPIPCTVQVLLGTLLRESLSMFLSLSLFTH
uniref:Uncharacterized protein n=1 Tax=Acinetobacter phage vB_Ab_1137_KEN_05 TaxID=3143020 RepID=A0AAU8KZE3_9VIRU